MLYVPIERSVLTRDWTVAIDGRHKLLLQVPMVILSCPKLDNSNILNQNNTVSRSPVQTADVYEQRPI